LEDLALEQHPVLKQARMRIEGARGRWVQAGLPPNPVAGYEGDEIGDAQPLPFESSRLGDLEDGQNRAVR
jgi:hypothetical protein